MRFVVLVKMTELAWRVYGTYRTFKAAENDAKACKYQAFVFPVTNPEELP